MLLLYFIVGKRLSEKIAAEKWGAKVLEQISADLQRELPGLRGFSYRNLRNMRQFAEEYSDFEIGQLVSAKLDDFLQNVFLCLGFSHHILLMNRCKNLDERRFYMENAVKNQWSHDILDHQIDARLFQKQGALPNNFAATLPENLRDKALLAFKDEYLLDFINVDPDDERVLEDSVVDNIRRFILTMGNARRNRSDE